MYWNVPKMPISISQMKLHSQVGSSCGITESFQIEPVSVSSVYLLSSVGLCDPVDCNTPGFLVHHQLPELTQTHVHRVSDAIQPSNPLSSPFPPTFPPFPASRSFPMSQFFASGGQRIGGAASALISFRMDWLVLLAVQGTLKSLLQHHSSKTSIFLCSGFLYSPTFTSIHDYWKNHSSDYTDLRWQSDVSAF